MTGYEILSITASILIPISGLFWWLLKMQIENHKEIMLALKQLEMRVIRIETYLEFRDPLFKRDTGTEQ